MIIMDNDNERKTVIYKRYIYLDRVNGKFITDGTDQIKRWFEARSLIVRRVSSFSDMDTWYAVECDGPTAMLAKLTWGGSH